MQLPVRTVSYGETALVVALLAIQIINHYSTGQYNNWTELWMCQASNTD